MPPAQTGTPLIKDNHLHCYQSHKSLNPLGVHLHKTKLFEQITTSSQGLILRLTQKEHEFAFIGRPEPLQNNNKNKQVEKLIIKVRHMQKKKVKMYFKCEVYITMAEGHKVYI